MAQAADHINFIYCQNTVKLKDFHIPIFIKLIHGLPVIIFMFAQKKPQLHFSHQTQLNITQIYHIFILFLYLPDTQESVRVVLYKATVKQVAILLQMIPKYYYPVEFFGLFNFYKRLTEI